MRTKLKEITTQITDGKHGDCANEKDSGFYFISCKDIIDRQLNLSNARQITEADCLDVRKRVAVQPGDTLITNSGTIGRTAILPDEPWVQRLAFQKSVAVLKPDNNRVRSDYFYYLIESCSNELASSSNGSAQKNLLLSTLRDFEVSIREDPKEQERIANILSAYDSLIENNRKQIKLLEEAAQRLYKEWFIDLHFPGHERGKINLETELPEGWTTKTIEQLCLRVQSGSTPSRKNPSYWDNAEHDWFKTAELEDHWLINSEENISSQALEETSVKEFPANSILMAIYASPTLGRLGLLSKEATFNQAALGFTADEKIISKEWLFQKLYELRPEFNSIARGAGQQNISGKIVKNYEVTLPSYDLIVGYTEIVRPIYRKMLKIQTQNIVLTEARNRLLPKLMSNEIEV